MYLRIMFPGKGELVLDTGTGKFSGLGSLPPDYLGVAQEMAEDYWGKYSVTHGYPGYMLCERVAKRLGGRAELPPAPPIPEGAVS